MVFARLHYALPYKDSKVATEASTAYQVGNKPLTPMLYGILSPAGLQYALPATLGAMQRLSSGNPAQASDFAKNKVSNRALQQLAKWWSAFPAELAGISSRKGKIVRGYDADLVVSLHVLLPCCYHVPRGCTVAA